jgi:hypothetical protein
MGAPGILEVDIETMVDAIKPFWEPICVDFEICEFRYIDNFQYDDHIQATETPQMQMEHNEDYRINIYFVTATDVDASYATGGGISIMDGGGIVMLKDAGFMTLAHEMGHYFGLPHTFEGAGMIGAELVDGSNCLTAGDGICDTPADPYIDPGDETTYLDVNTCEYTFMGQDANGDYYTPLVSNIMSYYHSCKCNFTYGQYQKMVETYYINPGMW